MIIKNPSDTPILFTADYVRRKRTALTAADFFRLMLQNLWAAISGLLLTWHGRLRPMHYQNAGRKRQACERSLWECEKLGRRVQPGEVAGFEPAYSPTVEVTPALRFREGRTFRCRRERKLCRPRSHRFSIYRAPRSERSPLSDSHAGRLCNPSVCPPR